MTITKGQGSAVVYGMLLLMTFAAICELFNMATLLGFLTFIISQYNDNR